MQIWKFKKTKPFFLPNLSVKKMAFLKNKNDTF